MERTGRTYTIYRITSPSGRQYVGCTSLTPLERWRGHIKRSRQKASYGHPFYDEIRKYETRGFKIENITKTDDFQEAMDFEVKYIAEVPRNLSMNLSRGGLYDASEGGRIFWERINNDPEKRKIYLEHLSAACKKRTTDRGPMMEGGKRWRQEHPREAYKIGYRSIRLALKSIGSHPPSYVKEDTRPLKERLMHRYKLSEIRRENTTKNWEHYTDEQRAEISRKISEGQKKRHEITPREEIEASCANARSYIDRSVQASAASAGLKKWWADLKADPVRYEAYISARTKTLKERKKNEDI